MVTKVAAYEWINDPKQTIRKCGHCFTFTLLPFSLSPAAHRPTHIFSSFAGVQLHSNFSKFYFSYRKIQESSSSHSIPHVALSSSEAKPPSLAYSIANAMDSGTFSAAHPSGTPQFKKKLLGDKQAASTSRDNNTGSHIAKHQSFDYSKSMSRQLTDISFPNLAQCSLLHSYHCTDSPMVSLVRSGSFMSAPRQPVIVKKSSIDGNGGGSDDSMHEKYFKSVENTPISRRRNQSLTCANQKHSSDSSPHSPMSPKKNVSWACFLFVSELSFSLHSPQTLRLARPTALGGAPSEPFHLIKSSQDNDTMDKSMKHER